MHHSSTAGEACHLVTPGHSRYPRGVSQWLRLVGCRVDLDSGAFWKSTDSSDESSPGHPAGTLSPTERELVAWLADRPGVEHPRDVLLREVWGYAATVVSRTVDTTMRRLRRKLEVDPGRPDHFHTARGVGYRFEPLVVAEPVSAPPAPSTMRLPAPLTPFVGQVDALNRLRALLEKRRLVTILGPGGVGKTRLALATATAMAAQFSHIRFWGLASVRDADGVRASLLTALGLPSEAPLQAARHALSRSARPLLVIDNAEHLVAPVALHVHRLLTEVPALTGLVTSRQPLQLRGEARFALGPLSSEDARALLQERALDVGVVLEDDHEVDVLADRLDRLPLAIELAAARLDDHSTADLLTGLADRFAVLASEWADTSPRQATMWGAIDWSWGLLNDVEQRALARLGLVRGEVPLAAAEALLGPLASGRPVQALRRTSLVLVEDGWVRLLDSVRDFANAHLEAERAAAAPGLARWLVDHAEACAADLDSPRHAAARHTLRRLRPDLLALWERHHTDLPDLAVRALLTLHGLLGAHAELEAARARYDAACSLDLTPEVACDLLLAAADVHSWNPGAETAAIDLTWRAFALAEGGLGPEHWLRCHVTLLNLASDPDLRARHADAMMRLGRSLGGVALLVALRAHGAYLFRVNRGDAALAAYEEAIAGSVDRPLTRARLFRRMAPLLARKGRRAEGIAHIEAAISLYAELEDWNNEGWSTNELGIIHLERSNHGPARRCFTHALARLRAAGDPGISAVLTNLAAVFHQDKDLDPARDLYTEALAAIEQGGRDFERALTLANLGNLELDAGRLTVARTHLDRALAHSEAQGAGWVTSLAAASRASLALLDGQLERSEAVARRGIACAEAGNWPRMLAFNLIQLGLLQLVRGDVAAAGATLRQAREHIDRHGDASVGALVRVRQGAWAVVAGEPELAAEFFAEAAAMDPHLSAAIALWSGESATPRFHEDRLAARYRPWGSAS